jgi:hypothetical protein
MIEILMDNLFYLIIPIGIIIVLIQIKNQKPSVPSVEEQSIEYQQKEIDGMLGTWSDLKDRFVEAKNDSATHAVYFGNEDVIKFYRTREDEYEIRNLVFTPAPSWYWGSDWENVMRYPIMRYKFQINSSIMKEKRPGLSTRSFCYSVICICSGTTIAMIK